MKLEDQVCTLEQAKRLKELGVRQDASYAAWLKNNCQEETEFLCWPVISPGVSHKGYSSPAKGCLEGFSAFTVAELGVMMPARVMSGGDDYFPQIHKGRRGWYIQYQTNKKDVVVNADGDIDRPRGYLYNTYRVAYNMAEAYASYLILLLENNVITPAEVNERLKATQ
jgi:hypothetical protein